MKNCADMSWWTPDRIAYAVNYLINNGGLSPYGAAGLVSRWAFVEAPNGPASRGGYMGHAWGIGQWLGPRLPPIDGNPDFDDQLAYVVQELNGADRTSASLAMPLLQSAQDAYTAARGASAYERASGWNAGKRTDNFTNKVAANVPHVLATWQSATGNTLDSPQTQTATQSDSTDQSGAITVSSMLVIGLGAGALLLLWLLTD